MKMGRIAVGLVAGLVSWVGCGGQPREEASPAEADQGLEQSCVYAYVECGYRGYQYHYAWPASCAVGTYTHAGAFAACHAECPWMCVDTGDIGAEEP